MTKLWITVLAATAISRLPTDARDCDPVAQNPETRGN